MIAFLIFNAIERARLDGISPTTVYLGTLDYQDLAEQRGHQSYVMRQVNKLTIVVVSTPRKIEIEGIYEHNSNT